MIIFQWLQKQGLAVIFKTENLQKKHFQHRLLFCFYFVSDCKNPLRVQLAAVAQKYPPAFGLKQESTILLSR